jgi:HlyD family secretion protein
MGKKIGLLLAGLLLLALTYWWARSGDEKASYLTARVERGLISQLVTATGTLNPVTTVQVGTYVSGPIKEIYVDFNSLVKEGQVVAKIDPRPFIMKVRQAEASLANIRAKVKKDKADLTYKQITLERVQELLRRNLVSRDAVDTAQSDYEQAQAQLELDRAQVKQTQAALEEARVNLGYTDIVSPVDGVVISRNVDVGQTVAASFQTPVLFLIARDLTKMQVNANVSEADIGLVAEGNTASFTVDAYPERIFWGTIRQVRNSPLIVQNVVTYDVVMGVDNPDLALKPGMTATVLVRVAHREDTLKIPLAALRFRPDKEEGADGKRVWVLTPQEDLHPVPVVTGISDDTSAELVSNKLKEGDEVVIGFRSPSATSPGTVLPGFGIRWRSRQ